MDLTQLTLLELRDAIAGGQTSAFEAARAYLDRIEKLDPELHCYHAVLADRALEKAKAVDAGAFRGKPLAGVPIALKDVLCTDFGATTCGSKMLEHYRSPFTATAVKKLEQAGAVILGKTNMDEFAMGSSTENSAFGVTKNPWDKSRVPGGSSGGSAAAMAAGLCAGSLGSDTGGSIRQPAAYCGIVGLKPTYGRISRWGLVAFASSLDQIGPFTLTVDDAALLLAVMAGHDELDSTSADLPVPDYLAELGNASWISGASGGSGGSGAGPLRIGLGKQYVSDQNDPAVNEAVRKAEQVFRGLGAQIVEIDLPHTAYGIPTYYLVATAEASSNLARYDGVHYGRRAKDATDLLDLYAASRAEGFGQEVQRRIMLGAYALSSGYYDAYYLRALKVRRLIKNDFDAAFAKVDVLMCPTTTGPAFKIGDKADDPLAMYLNDVYTVNASLTGLPAVSMPAGFTSAVNAPPGGLPIGLQFIGPAYEETRLLRVARLYEQATGYYRQRPAL
ncbi:MAG: Asp-tRNA(Asn)/Glu-tRNA(Gln) amidotransferase subunit GatA [Phycisphaeraceae bacterium]|nr:Asp-tRNA(Asn)/Glu-tRNA(Gln) amidotransferase subunit GatA [Phycisphaeraceae bacterium]